MLKEVVKSIKSFKNRGGLHIFLSTLIVNFSNLILTIILVRILSPDEYGTFSFLQAYLAFFIPFSGFGLNYSLLRFGAVEKEEESKKKLLNICIKYGLFFSIVLYIFVCIITIIASFKILNASHYILVFGLIIITTYLKDVAQSYLRIINNNISFAYSNIFYSLLLIILSMLAAFKWNIIGLMLAKVIVPLLIFFILIVKIKPLSNKSSKDVTEIKKFTGYGLFVGLGSVASQMLYQIDLFLLGIIIANTAIIAEYRVAMTIPFAALLIPSVLMTTDFVMIAEKYRDKQFLISYRNKIMKLLLLLSIFGTILIFFIGKEIILFLYGSQYVDAYKIMNILMVGIIGAFTIRTPCGNILAAVGKSKWSAYLSFGALGFNIILSYFLINYYGYFGAAIATTIVMWVTGILSYLLLNKYIKTL